MQGAEQAALMRLSYRLVPCDQSIPSASVLQAKPDNIRQHLLDELRPHPLYPPVRTTSIKTFEAPRMQAICAPRSWYPCSRLLHQLVCPVCKASDLKVRLPYVMSRLLEFCLQCTDVTVLRLYIDLAARVPQGRFNSGTNVLAFR